MHEFAHAAGIKHEQSRPDRDMEALILFSNIRSGTENNFEKFAYGYAQYYPNVPYDVSSVMHYSLTVWYKIERPRSQLHIGKIIQRLFVGI